MLIFFQLFEVIILLLRVINLLFKALRKFNVTFLHIFEAFMKGYFFQISFLL